MEKKDFSQALALAQAEYAAERAAAALPQADEALAQMLEHVFAACPGWAAFEGESLTGYLAFYPPRLWEDGWAAGETAVFSPLGASAFSGRDPARTAGLLWQAASAALVAQGVSRFAISRYAHEETAGRALVLSGFGIRCSDALRALDKPLEGPCGGGLTIAELPRERWSTVDGLSRELVRHLAAAPTFLRTLPGDEDEWKQQEELRVFAALQADRTVGYMALRSEGETFVSRMGCVGNLCGAYTEPAARGSGAAQALLAYVCQHAGTPYLGVDCETLNPTALHFWGKYFVPYTYTYAQSIPGVKKNV
ncbi:MAG: GNAT family N-acetyltransferase [Eubacteriales bacterium]|nr:GNAT family N-acetyltransferase [Eubacteriales bacterium]